MINALSLAWIRHRSNAKVSAWKPSGMHSSMFGCGFVYDELVGTICTVVCDNPPCHPVSLRRRREVVQLETRKWVIVIKNDHYLHQGAAKTQETHTHIDEFDTSLPIAIYCWKVTPLINPQRVGTELSRLNEVNVMAVDALAPYVARTSAAMLLTT